MHGARNDFVVLDQRTARLDDLVSFARWACDRHAGIGSDGLIALERSNRADLRMRTLNADGSEAEMCGNGIRCAARWLDEAGGGGRVAFDTPAGIVRTEIVTRKPEYLVRVAMGRPRFDAISLPGLENTAFVDLGNPHVVLFVSDVEDVDLEATALRLQTETRFPGGTNVHVAAALGEHALRVRHWERGVGLTMACGTGATACAAAAVQRNIVDGGPIDVFVPAGKLVVELDSSGNASLIGPAVRVFDTEVDVEFDSGP
jgi:diaminopimelate epimerase